MREMGPNRHHETVAQKHFNYNVGSVEPNALLIYLQDLPSITYFAYEMLYLGRSVNAKP